MDRVRHWIEHFPDRQKAAVLETVESSGVARIRHALRTVEELEALSEVRRLGQAREFAAPVLRSRLYGIRADRSRSRRNFCRRKRVARARSAKGFQSSDASEAWRREKSHRGSGYPSRGRISLEGLRRKARVPKSRNSHPSPP